MKTILKLLEGIQSNYFPSYIPPPCFGTTAHFKSRKKAELKRKINFFLNTVINTRNLKTIFMCVSFDYRPTHFRYMFRKTGTVQRFLLRYG